MIPYHFSLLKEQTTHFNISMAVTSEKFIIINEFHQNEFIVKMTLKTQ